MPMASFISGAPTMPKVIKDQMGISRARKRFLVGSLRPARHIEMLVSWSLFGAFGHTKCREKSLKLACRVPQKIENYTNYGWLRSFGVDKSLKFASLRFPSLYNTSLFYGCWAILLPTLGGGGCTHRPLSSSFLWFIVKNPIR